MVGDWRDGDTALGTLGITALGTLGIGWCARSTCRYLAL